MKIFIGIPCYGDVDSKVYEDSIRFAYYLGRRVQEHDFFLGIKTKSEQFRARAAIVQAARQINADYLLMLDDDMIIDIDDHVGATDKYEFIKKLLEHKKDICGILYFQRGGECRPVLMNRHGKAYRFLRDDEIKHGLQQVDVAGGGCLLINMRIFDKIAEPYFAPEYEFGTDIQLCQKAAKAGFEIWADTSIELGHVKSSRSIVTSASRHIHMSKDMISGEEKTQFLINNAIDDLVADAKEYTKIYDFDNMVKIGNSFMNLMQKEWKDNKDKLLEWYRKYPKERILRQVAFNVATQHKIDISSSIMASVKNDRTYKILDFGCGIGFVSFELARRGLNVSVIDIKGTGTLEFLKWRCKKHNINMNFIETDGSIPAVNSKYDIILALDSIEHIPEWQKVINYISLSLSDIGAVFATNGLIEDNTHPEHFRVSSSDFITEMVKNGLYPINQICYIKKQEEVKENGSNIEQNCICG
jgi:2-polyprenyl-3-methyl-5-hydroxy-6-metoxy-1,4-benzoquinol methylase